ncbi:hypothetical protein GCM10027590_55170 [Nocardiopsis nanhaiensis]
MPALSTLSRDVKLECRRPGPVRLRVRDPCKCGTPASAGGFPVSCRPMVAVSAARLKVVAIERFARQWRSTLTRFAATAGRRLSGNGGRVVGEAMGPLGPKGPYGTSTAWRPSAATPPER